MTLSDTFISTMKCIHNIPNTTLLLHHTDLRQHHLSSKNCQQSFTRPRITQTTKAAALSPSITLVLADAVVAQTKGDINVFLQTGGLMFAAYFVANFVVPNIVSKQLQQQQQMDESASAINKETESKKEKLNEQPKNNRGFNSTKP